MDLIEKSHSWKESLTNSMVTAASKDNVGTSHAAPVYLPTISLSEYFLEGFLERKNENKITNMYQRKIKLINKKEWPNANSV